MLHNDLDGSKTPQRMSRKILSGHFSDTIILSEAGDLRISAVIANFKRRNGNGLIQTWILIAAPRYYRPFRRDLLSFCHFTTPR
jgi:hypothetical protein